MNDWYPTREQGNAAKLWDKHLDSLKGKNRFDIKLSMGEFDPDFSTTQPQRNFGGLFLHSFGVRKGREIFSFGDWTKGNVESMITVIRNDKAPRDITWLWMNDGRKNFFDSFKGKKLVLELDFTVATPGTVNILHYHLKLNDCHIKRVSPEYHTIDKKSVKLERISATCGSLEFEAAE
jgi:hypothetical protein